MARAPRRRPRQGPALPRRRATTARCWATPTPTSSGRARPTASASRTRSTSHPDAAGRGFGRLLLAELLRALRGGRRPPDARGDRRLGQRRLDRRAPRARLRARRHHRRRGWKFERWLRRRAHAAQPRRRAPRWRPHDARRDRTAAGHAPRRVATWLAFLGGRLGLHRFYLRGARDAWAGCSRADRCSASTASGACASLGVDDCASWALIPLLASRSRRRCCTRSSTA